MCCQPPLRRNDLDGYFRKNMALIDSAPSELPSIGITGGEPTLLGERLFDMIRHIKMKLPDTEIHLADERASVRRQGICAKTSSLWCGKFAAWYSAPCR